MDATHIPIRRISPLAERLRALRVGESLTEPGVYCSRIQRGIERAKVGGKWFTAKTLVNGVVRIQRYE